ncbi:hypothetical protein M728_000198 [Ensifer sp. WSM1721]|uniref:hypothetical protein n=1 Tax=Ensifer sp. WSM1721 TaxID=1041159 RepID=UPI0012EC9BA9|nr:hypothetical protein [Ensifer sp. WSM1721]
MSPKNVQRFWDNDMRKKGPKARRMNSIERDALQAPRIQNAAGERLPQCDNVTIRLSLTFGNFASDSITR